MLPRRVPWLSTSEFEQVYAWLFRSEGDAALQRRALDRILTWQARGGCPQAVEATADLLDATLHAAGGQLSSHAVRLTYSMAIIRFVNGLVDPLQQGYYARSIGSIAAQLGLPLHFVELRHAATHEALPSLAALQPAARQALDWLHARYWLPQLQPAAAELTLDDALAGELAKLLDEYDRLHRLAARDATKVTPRQLQGAIDDVERHVSNAAPADRLDAVLAALAGQLAHERRLLDGEARAGLALPADLLARWTPLLDRLRTAFATFEQALLLRLLDTLCAASPDDELMSVLASGDTQLHAAWAMYLATRADADPLLLELAVRLCLLHPNPSTLALLGSLGDRVEAVDALVPLAKVHASRAVRSLITRHCGCKLKVEQPAPSVPEDVDAVLERMQGRLDALAARLPQSQAEAASPAVETEMAVDPPPIEAWTLVDEDRWRPCPIGCLPGGTQPRLEWPIVLAT